MDQRRRKDRQAYIATYTARWYERDPRRKAAHVAVKYALRRGQLTRQPCEHCGARAEAHHGDYAQPLAVRWYCRRHHRQHHAIMRVMGTWGG